MKRTPFISVLITAYDRREFIKEAIDSALSQSLDKEEYEIVVIKNYKDESIDKYIDENNIKNIYSKDITLAGKLAEGTLNSNGEIICFLEDDDLFTEGKLLHVYNLFKKYKNLVYYHNDYNPIDAIGDKTTVENKRIWFNMSCISVRRDILELEKLRKISGWYIYLDLVAYCEALSSRGKIMKDSFKGTFYRFHKSASNPPIDSSFEKSMATWNERKTPYLDGLKIIKESFSEPRVISLVTSLETGKIMEGYLRGGQEKPKHIFNFLLARRSNISLKNKLKKIFFYYLSRIFRNKIMGIYNRRKNQDYSESKTRLKKE